MGPLRSLDQVTVVLAGRSLLLLLHLLLATTNHADGQLRSLHYRVLVKGFRGVVLDEVASH